MGTDMTTLTALWGAVILSGLYHGVNPGMGWPLAVSAALMEGKRSAMGKALVALAAGHFLSMTAILLPFSLMTTLVSWEMQIRIGAGALVVAMGIYLLINRKHPRYLARVHPARLALWSFLAALAHGAGLMLVPIYLGICGGETGPSEGSRGRAGTDGPERADRLRGCTGSYLCHDTCRRHFGDRHLPVARAEIPLSHLVQSRYCLGA